MRACTDPPRIEGIVMGGASCLVLKMENLRLLLCLCVYYSFTAVLFGTGSGTPTESKPNIVLLFADDLGYGDPSCYGHPTSSTPNIDKMASEGLFFTQFYTGAPVCSPSRAALLTGRFHPRPGIYPGVFFPDHIGGLPHNETTIAESLKTVGYSTAIVGKWHLGVGENLTYLPTNYGFDYYMGIPYSHDMCPCLVCFYPNVSCAASNNKCGHQYCPCPIFENDKIVQQPADFLKMNANYMNAATSFIKTKAAQGSPFFLYMAFQHTHRPQFAGQQFTNSSIRGMFGDALAELDWGVGQILEALKDAGVEENTFVFFTSDNGPSLVREIHGGNQGLLRCGKGSTWDGGQRVPGIARWPGRIRTGKTFELAATVDLFPTLLNLAGAMPPSVILDGFDMAPILFEGKQSNRIFYPFYSAESTRSEGMYAFRFHQYKAHYYTKGGLCGHTYPDMVCRGNYSLHKHDPPLLFDLHSDPSEQYPLSAKEYNQLLIQIDEAKTAFESTMTWGESQMDRGRNSTVEPCASPGCSPFPTCCRTDLLSPNMSRKIP